MESIIKKAPVLHQFVQLLLTKEISDTKVFHQAKRVVADTLGTAYSGINNEAFQSAIKLKDEFFGSGGYPVWGTTETTNLPGAVFFNALTVSSTDFDEGHRKAAGHPAAVVVPVALMLGQKLGKTYAEILKAVITGYEAGTRFAHAKHPEHIKTYSTGRWGALAAAATASCLLNLNTDKTMHALSLAYVLSPAMQGGSTDVSTGAMSKEGVAWAAQSGLQSALLAQNGFTGPWLFIDAYDEIDKEKLVADDNADWLIQSNYFKPFACCRWLHTAIHLLLELKAMFQFESGQVQAINVSIFKRAFDLIDAKYPENTIQAQFHLPFVMACALLFGEVSPKEFNENNLQSRSVRKVIDLIRLLPDDGFTEAFPLKIGSRVTVMFKNGDMLSKAAYEAPWDTGNPPSDDALYIKFKDQVGEHAEAIWNKYLHTD